MIELSFFCSSISMSTTSQVHLEPSFVVGFRLHRSLFDERLLNPVQCCNNQISWKLIFAINGCKRNSEFPGMQVVEPDTTVSLKSLFSYSPTLRKISRPKDSYGSNNKFPLCIQIPHYTPMLTGSQDSKHLLVLPYHSPCWGWIDPAEASSS